MPEKNYYAERVAKGLCGMCGRRPPEPGSRFCAEDREKLRQRAAAQRARRAAVGKCVIFGCLNKPVPGCKRCAEHIQLATERRRKVYKARKAAGKCAFPGCDVSSGPGHAYCEKHRAEISKQCLKYYHKRIAQGLCGYCGQLALPGLKCCQKHKDYTQQYYVKLKTEVVMHYSKGTHQCAGCDCRDLSMLEIDHTEGGGRQHFLREGLHGGYDFYLWLKRNNFPDGFRVLCRECNRLAARQRPLPSGAPVTPRPKRKRRRKPLYDNANPFSL